MKSPHRLLLLEDNPDDAELLRRNLAAEWPQCELVQVSKRANYESALEQGGFDLILSDYLLPGIKGPAALALARDHCPEVPFIFVSGAIGDEVAVESLKAGATDYVLKDRLAKLVPSIRRGLNEAEERARRRQVEEELRRSEEQCRDLLENATDLIQSVAPDGCLLYVNPAWRNKLEYTEAEVARLTLFEMLHPEYHEGWRDRFESARPDEASRWEGIFLSKYGSHLYVEGNTSFRYMNGNLAAIRGIFHDVTERKLP